MKKRVMSLMLCMALAFGLVPARIAASVVDSASEFSEVTRSTEEEPTEQPGTEEEATQDATEEATEDATEPESEMEEQPCAHGSRVANVVDNQIFWVCGDCGAELGVEEGTLIYSTVNVTDGVKLRWNTRSGASKYAVYFKAHTASKWKKAATTSALTYTKKSLKSGTEYDFYVACLDKKGKTMAGSSPSVTIRYLSVPVLTASVQTADGIKVTWKPVTGADRYRVLVKNADDTWEKMADVSGTTAEITGLAVGVEYTFTVACLDENGEVASAYNTKGKNCCYVSTTQLLALDNSEGMALGISWERNEDADGYQIMLSTSRTFAADNKTYLIVGNETTEKQATKLSPYKTYYVQIRCYKSVDTTQYFSAWSDALSARTQMKTSTDSPFQANFDAMMRGESFWGKEFGPYISTIDAEHSWVIPGLTATNLGGGSYCDKMVPQGTTVLGDYLLISAVCESEERAHKANHRSVLYVVDNRNGQYLKTLVLNSKSHLGGIAAGDGVIYIADSKSSKSSNWRVMKITEEQLNSALASEEDFVPVEVATAFRTPADKPAYMFWYDGRIWVGGFNLQIRAKNYVVPYTVAGVREGSRKLQLPLKSQGASIAKIGDTEYLMASISYGRRNFSKLYVYELSKTKKGEMTLLKGTSEVENPIVMPTMSEDMAIRGDKVYIAFESGSNEYKQYSYNGRYALDRVMVSSARKIVELLAGD